MATFEITAANATVVGTLGDDTLVYGDNSVKPLDGFSFDGRGGNDTVDFSTNNNYILVPAAETSGLTDVPETLEYDASTQTMTIDFRGTPAESTLVSVETLILDNGTLDFTGEIAGQYLAGDVTTGTYNGGPVEFDLDRDDTLGTTGTYDSEIYQTVAVEGEDDLYTLEVVGLSSGGSWVVSAVNGQAIDATGVVLLDEGSVNVSPAPDMQGQSGLEVTDAFAFYASKVFVDGIAYGETESVTFNVTFMDSGDAENTVTIPYTVLVEGGAGPDFTTGNDFRPNFDATEGVADALAGDDFVSGSAGDDMIFGNDGNDRIFAGADDLGGDNDGNGINDMFAGGDGDDVIGGGAGNDILIGDSVNSVNFVDVDSTDSDIVLGDVDTDDGNDIIYGGTGNDWIVTGNLDGNNPFENSNGDDVTDRGLLQTNFEAVVHGEGNDTVWAGEGDDNIFGDDGDDVLGGGDGNDYVNAGAGNDTVYASTGDDTVKGGDGDDIVFGGEGNDSIEGGAGTDTLYGGAGDDSLTGGAGADMLYAGGGNDALTGGTGVDTFYFNTAEGENTITDFNTEEDKIDVSEFDLTWADVQNSAYQVGDDSYIALSDDVTVILSGVGLDAFGEGDFIF
ncbi:hemolysin type calcium-binding protein [Rhodovulum bhavnagarense]|uniref:Hemolysin type calcium-binding protein n=1 Tax=Rhodovulum bhavnagarense TaxID=992286 RepID=A0A4R2R617_9RHOB|nr:calcium-binding protein [Rhodovulum bhavnagarense]TCP58452.1 hemolysin type calcium-binding protein [Rhodovulum bhavnagarense]